ncbi:MAG: S-layer homology domain-containing protein [Stenomitos rutilans HA7619-LM2]|jgi:hypothetical protein|nr:S-layer homology domain-containing protein [Stenomitos rutilans HA7619-LM2]
MRISTATTLVCSSLATVAFYQGFVALFPHLAHPDDADSQSKQDGTKTEAEKTAKPAIVAPESMPAVSIDAGAKVPTQAEPAVAQRQAVALRKLPKVNLPPTLRSMRSTMAERAGEVSTQMPSSVALPETMSTGDTDFGASREVSSITAPVAALTDVKGHWAEGYIESLAVKGIVRGFVDGKFHPDEPVTSGQFTMMVEKAFQVAPITYGDLQRLKGDRPTRADAAALIYNTLAKAGPSPVATAVQISGAVPRPGIYAVPSSSATSRPTVGLPTVSQAIQQAGGALTGADLRQVQIHRVNDVTERQVINVDVAHALQTGDRNQDPVLHQGDKLFIPAATATTSEVTSPLPKPAHSISLAEPSK